MTATFDRTSDLDRLRVEVAGMSGEQLRAFALTLTTDELDLLEQVVAEQTGEHWRSHPMAMANYLSGGDFKLWRYVVLLSKAYAAGIRGELVRQQWWLPSQYGKTTILGNWGPVWALDYDPTLRLMYVSHDADKAVEEGGKARDLAERFADQLRFRLRPDKRARGQWNTDQGGGLYCVGVNGSIVGWPADHVTGDDLIKGWQAAHSEAVRKQVWAVYTSQMRLRVQGVRSAILLGGTRWHEDDPQGRALKNPDPIAPWHIIRLPAIAEQHDPDSMDPLLRVPDALGRQPGEVLEPDRFPAEEVHARAVVLGSYLAAALEQQRPAPEEGDIIKRAWWKLDDAAPVQADDWLTSWDTKYAEKRQGDYVVGQAWCRVGTHYWCVDQLRGQWDSARTKAAIALMKVRHPQIVKHWVENTGKGPEVREQLTNPDPTYLLSDDVAGDLGMTEEERAAVELVIRQGLAGILPTMPSEPKAVRARAVAGYIEAGHVHLAPKNADWVSVLVDEAAAFPNSGTNDDTVDAWSLALAKLTKMPDTATVTNPAQMPPLPAVVPGTPLSTGITSAGMSLPPGPTL